MATTDSDDMAIAAAVLVFILLLVKYAKGFVANISVLLGIVIGCVVAVGMGKMNFDKVGKAHWFDVVTPFAFGMPTFDIVMILTMTLVMIVVMIESTGMFLALSDITGKKIDQPALAAGLRTDGLGTLIGGLFNTFPYTSFSQNVGLMAVKGVKSRFVRVAGGALVCLRAARFSTSLARRCALKPKSIITARISLIVAGSLTVRKAIAAAVPGLKRFLPCFLRKLRMATDTSPKSMSTGHGLTQR